MDDHELAARLAGSAGEVLSGVQSAGLLAGKQLGEAGDRVAQAWLATALGLLRPADGLLSEEGCDPSAAAGERLWIVDPLDGTREFSESRPDWAVHVALLERGELVAAAVALSGLRMVYSTSVPVVLPPATGRLRIAVSRSRPPEFVAALARALDADVVPMGSAGFKAMAVLRGDVHAYLHAGGQYEWDSAAPVGVARHAGLHASRIDGSPLVFGKSDPWSPDLLICRAELAEQILAGLSETLPAVVEETA